MKAPLKVLTLGMVDMNEGGLKITDPLTGMLDLAEELTDLQ